MATPTRALCVVGTVTAFISFAFSQAPSPEGRVTSIYHDVQVLPTQAAPHTAAINDVVDQDSALRTGSDSRSEITFGDLTITRLGENTIFTVNQAGRSVRLDSGSILLYAKKNSGAAQITTKAVTVGITGTTVIFESEPANYDRLLVLEGDARFSLNEFPEQAASVRAGQLLNAHAGARKLPRPSRVDLRRIMRTHPLITNFPPLPSLDLIYAAMRQQNPKAPLPSGPTTTGVPNPVSRPTNPGPPPAALPPTGGGYVGPIPNPTAPPHRPSPAPTAIASPTSTPRPTPRRTPTPRRPIHPPKGSPTPKRWPPPKKGPTASPSPVIQ